MKQMHELRFVNKTALKHTTKERRIWELHFVNKNASNHDKKEHIAAVKQHAAFRRWDRAFEAGDEVVRKDQQLTQAQHVSNVQAVTPPWGATASRQTSLSILSIGGLRSDSFNTFPISNDGQVPIAFDYFTTIYSHRGILPGRTANFLNTYLQTILHNAMLFEAMVAFSIAMLLYQGRVMSKRDFAEVLHHLNNTMESLRRQLCGTDYADDAVILTILLIAGANLFLKDLHTFNIHIEAANDLVTRRGGPSSLGMDGYVKERWAQGNLLRAGLQLQPVAGLRHDLGTADGNNIYLKYPALPFSADLKDKISLLPEGPHRLASAQELSIHVIGMLFDCLPSLRKGNYVPPESDVFLRSRPNFRATEHLIYVALVACSLFVSPENGYTASIMEGHLNYQVRLLAADNEVLFCDPDAVYWAKSMLRATSLPNSEPWCWATDHLIETGELSGEEEELRVDEMSLAIPSHRISPRRSKS